MRRGGEGYEVRLAEPGDDPGDAGPSLQEILDRVYRAPHAQAAQDPADLSEAEPVVETPAPPRRFTVHRRRKRREASRVSAWRRLDVRLAAILFLALMVVLSVATVWP